MYRESYERENNLRDLLARAGSDFDISISISRHTQKQ